MEPSYWMLRLLIILRLHEMLNAIMNKLVYLHLFTWTVQDTLNGPKRLTSALLTQWREAWRSVCRSWPSLLRWRNKLSPEFLHHDPSRDTCSLKNERSTTNNFFINKYSMLLNCLKYYQTSMLEMYQSKANKIRFRKIIFCRS